MNSNYWLKNKLAKFTYLYAKTVSENVTTFQASNVCKKLNVDGFECVFESVLCCRKFNICHSVHLSLPPIETKMKLFCHFPFRSQEMNVSNAHTKHLFQWHIYYAERPTSSRASKYFYIFLCQNICVWVSKSW